MVQIQAIPAPTDSYDHANSTKANMTSLRAMFASFDATMDAFHEEIQNQLDLLEKISQNNSKCRDDIQAKSQSVQGLDSDDVHPININCPATHEEAIMPASGFDSLSMKISVLEKARALSNRSVRSVLREEASGMEVTAKPSDLWLDKPSAFDKESECQQALKMHSVPPLIVNNSVKILGKNCGHSSSSTIGAMMKEEAEYYREKIMEETSLIPENHKKDDDDGSEVSEYSRGTTYSNYSTLSLGTASHRRRQRKMAAAHRRSKGKGSGHPERRIGGTGGRLSGRGDAIRGNSITSSRQQVMTGSLPYVCVMLHDTNGLGEPDNPLYPPISNVNDLFVFGTDELAYSFGETRESEVKHHNLSRTHDDGKVPEKVSLGTMKGKASSSDLYQLKEEEENDDENPN